MRVIKGEIKGVNKGFVGINGVENGGCLRGWGGKNKNGEIGGMIVEIKLMWLVLCSFGL